MGDQGNTNPPVAAQPQQQTATKKIGNSPWDEELDLPAEPKKPIVGSLDPSAPFAVPDNVSEKVGQKVPATNYVNQPKAPVEAQGGPNPVPPSPASTAIPPAVAPAPVPRVETITAPSSMPKPVINTVDDVTATATPGPVAEDFSDMVPPAETATTIPPGQVPSTGQQKQSLFAKMFAGKKKPNSLEPAVAAEPSPVVAPPAVASSTPTPVTESQIAQATGGSLGRKIFLVGAIIIVLFAFLSVLTELGFLSLGLEKVYGAVGVESFWGGLSSNPEKALALSASKMKENLSYKIDGTIKITVDGQGSSEIISPLISSAGGLLLARDTSSSSTISAIKTAVEDYQYDLYNIDSTDGGSATGASDTTTTSSSDSTASSSTSATTGSSTTPTPTAISTQALPSTSTADSLKVIEASVALKTSPDGVESNIKIKDSQNSLIDLVNSGSNLYVKTSGAVTYNKSATSDQWTKYAVSSLDGKNVQAEAFNIRADSGLSAKGSRLGSDKVGGVRCFRYHLDSVELGNSLSVLGIGSSSTQTISGDVWIGIKDKLIRRIVLNITTPVSATARIINADLTFSAFGASNTISTVDASSVLDASARESADDDTAVALTGDAKRKDDLNKIALALAEYYSQYSSYPVAATSIKLNQSGNLLERALVPAFIQAMPLDEKTNWYYGYISDGRTFSLSARLENTSDPAGTRVGDILLYTKTSN